MNVLSAGVSRSAGRRSQLKVALLKSFGSDKNYVLNTEPKCSTTHHLFDAEVINDPLTTRANWIWCCTLVYQQYRIASITRTIADKIRTHCMKRRGFVGGTCCLFAGMSAGCVTESSSEPDPEIGLIEVKNDRQDESYVLTIEIIDMDYFDNEEVVVFNERQRLGPAGSGNSAVVFENPVEPGEYTVCVDVGEYSASAETRGLIEHEQPCLRLQFYLGTETLHMEPQLYDRCE